MDPVTPSDLRAELEQLVGAARVLFPDLEYVGPGGVLEVDAVLHGVERIRIEGAEGRHVQLQSLRVEGPDGRPVDPVGVAVSGWYGDYGDRFELARMADFDNPSGTTVHTTAEPAPWCEVTLPRRSEVHRIRMRNVAGQTAVRARGMRVLAEVAGTSMVVYDHAERVAELATALRRRAGVGCSAVLRELVPIVAQTFAGDYAEARKAFEALELTDEASRAFRGAMTASLLTDRRLEWTVHGPQRCFRFWSQKEKTAYTRSAAEVAQELADLTPNVCFGFGAALCVVRDGDFIPHDDDLDIIIGFEPHEAETLGEGLRRVEEHLRPRGFTVSGNFSAHRHVRRGSAKHVDVFVGLFEGDTISWYPGNRGALTREMMFPPSAGTLHGVEVPLPRNPLLYLERLYGPSWRNPDPNFRHTWDRSAYADLTKPRR